MVSSDKSWYIFLNNKIGIYNFLWCSFLARPMPLKIDLQKHVSQIKKVQLRKKIRYNKFSSSLIQRESPHLAWTCITSIASISKFSPMIVNNGTDEISEELGWREVLWHIFERGVLTTICLFLVLSWSNAFTDMGAEAAELHYPPFLWVRVIM